MTIHVAAMAANLTDPPKPVDPIGTWGIAGHSLLLVIGLVFLVGAGALWRAREATPAALIAGLGVLTTWWAETRFLRAIHPDSVGLFRWTIAAFVVAIVAAAVLASRTPLTGVEGAAGVGAGGLIALIGAWGADHLFESMAAVPIAIGTILAGVALVWLVARER